MSNFYHWAKKYAAMGCKVFPIAPGTKTPLTPHGVKDASNFDPQLRQWGDQYPDAGIAIACDDLEVGDIAVLEFDQKPTLATWAKQDNQPMFETRIHLSGGKRLPHFLFKQTEYSLQKLGNCDGVGDYCNDPNCEQGRKKGGLHRHEWFSFRAHNRYVIAPPSIHPSGNPYTVRVEMDPQPIPDWVVDAILKRGKREKQIAQEHGFRPVSPKFDFDAWLQWLDMEVATTNGAWHGFKTCPVAGYKHTGQNDLSSAVWWDGEHLGFRCQAAECPSNQKREGNQGGIGCLMRLLQADDKLGRYDGEIWEAAATDGFDVEEDVDKPEPEAPKTEPSVKADEPKDPPSNLDFPEECIEDDKLGDMAKETHVHLGLSYPSVLVCSSVKPTADKMCGTRINLYGCLIVPVGGGKNVTIGRALEVTDLVSRVDYTKSAPGGDAQLVSLIGDRPTGKRGDHDRIPGPHKMLLVCNEIADMLIKTGIDNSTLASRMCDFWDDNEYDKPLPKGEVCHVDCRLSWIGGLPASVERPERFKELFGGESNYGLYPRFIWGYSPVKFNYRDWSRKVTTALTDDDASIEMNGGVTYVESISPEAMEMWEAFTPGITPGNHATLEDEGRVKYNAKKIAILKAAFNGETVVTAKRMAQAIRFMEWQIEIQKAFSPGHAKESNREAWFTEHLIPSLERAGASDKFVNWRRISLNNRWDEKIDATTQLRTVKSLVSLGRLIEEDVEGRKTPKYPRVRLRAI